MAKFKCVYSGCIYEWLDEDTIKRMRQHSEYVEVVEDIKAKKPVKAQDEH